MFGFDWELFESFPEEDGALESRTGEELRTLEEERKDCSKGLGSRLKSVRVGRGAGRGRVREL